MRLALKITWVALVSTAVGLAVQAKLRLDSELSLIDQDMRRDQRLMGRTLLPLLETSYKDGGAQAFDKTIAAAYESEREIGLRVVPRSSLDTEISAGLARGTEVVTTATEPPSHLITYFSLALDDAEPLVLELSEPLTSKSDFSAAALREFLLLLGWLMAATTLSGALAGYWLVGRRVERLVRSARAVSGGDYSVDVAVADDGWDEISMLSREMSKMTEQLRRAEVAARTETARRGQLTQRLRHTDRLATVGALASRLAHDVGAPLNVIGARAKMIARGEVEGDEARRNAEIVAGQTDRIAEKVREMLGFARRKSAPREPVRVRRVIEDTKTLLESLARLHGVRVVVDGGLEGSVTVVELQLQQALVNLVVNAIHASPADTDVTISVQRASVEDPPPHAAQGMFLMISISDAGSGVPEAMKATIFEPFFTTKESHEGTGLGLPIARDIVRDHGGFIRVVGREPRGTSFQLFIPEARDDG